MNNVPDVTDRALIAILSLIWYTGRECVLNGGYGRYQDPVLQGERAGKK